MGWNGFGGYHGLLLKKCASLIDRSFKPTVLDVGCGAIHLFELLKDDIESYVGVDNNEQILNMARERYPYLRLLNRSVYSLGLDQVFDYVFAIGLYSDKPKKPDGITEMLRYTNKKLIMTYWKDENGVELPPFKVVEIKHNIDPKLAIVEIEP
jgi:ubiquinone/menaquinone biosynthesis C-methylase UbiE